MTALKIDQNETALLRAHYEGVMRDTLRIIWHRKLLVAAILVAALVLASIALVLVGPRYTGEAIIQLSFSREESASSARSQPIVSVEAAALVDSAARVIRSRTTARPARSTRSSTMARSLVRFAQSSKRATSTLQKPWPNALPACASTICV